MKESQASEFDLWTQVSVVADLSPGVYYIVPYTFDAGQLGKFELFVHADKPLRSNTTILMQIEFTVWLQLQRPRGW